jgi:hypothetical protein
LTLIDQILGLSAKWRARHSLAVTFRLQRASLLFGFARRYSGDQISGTRRDGVRPAVGSSPGLWTLRVVRLVYLGEPSVVVCPDEPPTSCPCPAVFAFFADPDDFRPDLRFCDMNSVSAGVTLAGSSRKCSTLPTEDILLKSPSFESIVWVIEPRVILSKGCNFRRQLEMSQ